MTACQVYHHNGACDPSLKGTDERHHKAASGTDLSGQKTGGAFLSFLRSIGNQYTSQLQTTSQGFGMSSDC